jgi:Protein of unknown function with HXXEE motif
MTPSRFFMRHWHDVGILSAAITGVYLVAAWDNLGILQQLLLLNFIVVLIHQFEEYSWPGGFPALANVVMLSTDFFSRYFKPLNQLSSMAANLIATYVFFLLPVFFPHTIWLGLAPVLVGAVLQLIVHAIMAPYMLRSIYTPGVATTVLGFLPVGVIYIHYIQANDLATGWDWLAAVGYLAVAVVVIFYVIEQLWLGGENPRYPFDRDEMERFQIVEKFEAARRIRDEKRRRQLV